MSDPHIMSENILSISALLTGFRMLEERTDIVWENFMNAFITFCRFVHTCNHFKVDCLYKYSSRLASLNNYNGYKKVLFNTQYF